MAAFKKYLRILLKIFFPTVGFLLTVGILWKGALFFMPFVIGWIIAMIGNPIVRYLERKLKIVRKAGSFLLVAGVLALIILGGYALMTRIISGCISFMQDAPEILVAAQRQVESFISAFSGLKRFFPETVWEGLVTMVGDLEGSVDQIIAGIGEPTVHAAGNFAKGLPNAFVYAVITVLSSYFFIADSDMIMESLKEAVPQPIVHYAALVKKNLMRAVGGYFAAQFKIMIVVAVILTVGFLLIGIHYSVLWAILIALLDFLPVFGTGTVLIPWAVIEFFNRQFYMGVALLVLYFVSQLVRQLIQPKIVGDSMGLPPLLTLILLYIGFRLGGVSGMILAVPLGLILIEIYKAGVFDTMIEGVQELIREVRQFMRQENEK